jgi:RNase P subunit RPR2
MILEIIIILILMAAFLPILMCILLELYFKDRKRNRREHKRVKLLTEVAEKKKLEAIEKDKEYFCKICERNHSMNSNIGIGHYNREKN